MKYLVKGLVLVKNEEGNRKYKCPEKGNLGVVVMPEFRGKEGKKGYGEQNSEER